MNTLAPSIHLLLRQFFCCAVVLLALFRVPVILAQTTDPETGKTVEIRGIEDPELRTEFETRVINYLKNDDLVGLTEFLAEHPMTLDVNLVKDTSIVYHMVTHINLRRINPSDPLFDRLRTLRGFIEDDDLDGFLEAAKSVPEVQQTEVKSPDDSSQIELLIVFAARNNNLALIQWLENNCPICSIDNTGSQIIRDVVQGGYRPVRLMNAETFQYMYEKGAVDSFLEKYEDYSIVVQIASYWIPEIDGGYSDYTVTDHDKEQYEFRSSQRLKILTYLFSQGHSVNETQYDQTAIYIAVNHGNDALIDFLFKHDIDPAIGRNPLASVTGTWDPDRIRFLIRKGYDVREPTKSAYSSPGSDNMLARIVESERAFNPALMDLVDELELDVTVVDKHGKDAITYAAYEYGQAEQPFTDFLLERGAKKSDPYFYEVVREGIIRNNYRNLQDVLMEQPDLANGLPGKHNGSPLIDAVASQNHEIFDLLISHGAKLSDEPGYGALLLESTLWQANYELADKLLKQFPDIDVNRVGEKNGESKIISPSLKIAASYGAIEYVNLLLARGAALDAIDFFDYPIVASAMNNHYEIVERLLEEGSVANPESEDKSLIDYVREAGHNEIVELLKSHEK